MTSNAAAIFTALNSCLTLGVDGLMRWDEDALDQTIGAAIYVIGIGDATEQQHLRAHLNSVLALLTSSGDITPAGRQQIEHVLDSEGITA
jgi:hypothetical protein